MQFSDTSAAQNGLIQSCEFWTGLGKAQISGNTQRLNEFTRLINQRYDQLTMLLFQIQDEWDFDDSSNTGYPILTRDLVANQQDYLFTTAKWDIEGREGAADTADQASGAIQIKRVEITYDGTTWYKAEPFDIGERGEPTDTTTLAANYTKSQPYYDIQYGAIWLYPIPDTAISNGLKIWIARNVDAFTSADTTQTPGFDRAFHELPALGASLDWSIAKGKDIRADLQVKVKELEQQFVEFYSSKQKDRQTIMKSAFIDYD